MESKSEAHRHVFENSAEIANFVAEKILEEASNSTSERGIFTLGVSGGSIIKILAEKLSTQSDIEWNKWKIFFCDERLVPFSDPESTFAQYKKMLIDVVGHQDSWVPINPNLSVDDCAVDYGKKVRHLLGDSPRFDMLLLGMGPDGHTCSLFPGHELLQEEKLVIAPISDSPKPPSCRITMTLPVLNNARNVMFISAGASKADTIKNVFAGTRPPLPASLVKPSSGVLRWVMDKSAASKI